MGLVSRFRTAFGRAPAEKSQGSAGVPAQGFLPTLGATPSATSLLISQGTAMAVSAVYACVSIRSQDVARCTPRLFEKAKEEGDKRKLITNHPVAKLLARPNERQNWFEFCEQVNAGYLLRGNGYAAIQHDSRGKPVGLIPVSPDAAMVLEAPEGQIFYNVNRVGLWQMAMLKEFPVTIPAENMFHLRGLTFNALVAASTINLARDSIGVAMALEQQAARWMANGARPSVVLQTKKSLNKEAADRLKQQWNDLFGGLMNVGRTAVLEDGIEAKPLALTTADIEYISQRNFQLIDIARFYRMPPLKLGLSELRGVNLVEVNQDYVTNTIMPDVHRWEQKLEQTFDLDAEGLEVDMDESNLLRADITSRYNAARIGLLSGFLKPNEVRAAEGLEPVDGGDVVYHPLNMAPLGSDIDGNAGDGAGRPAFGQEGGKPADATDGAAPTPSGPKPKPRPGASLN
jgi:HK97 family phage portal protein